VPGTQQDTSRPRVTMRREDRATNMDGDAALIACVDDRMADGTFNPKCVFATRSTQHVIALVACVAESAIMLLNEIGDHDLADALLPDVMDMVARARRGRGGPEAE